MAKTDRSKKRPDDEFKFSKSARADFFEALSLIRPDLADKIPPVHRREDRRPTGKSRAGRPRDPELALWRFYAEFSARAEFGAARDLRDARRIAAREETDVLHEWRDDQRNYPISVEVGL